MKKQTAVEWFVKQLQSNSDIRWRGTNINELAEQAKEMEKAQMEQLKDFEKWKEWKNEPQ